MSRIVFRESEYEVVPSIQDKTLRINLNKDIYGSFAEIGAGQETARHFFQSRRCVWNNCQSDERL
jgi:hypothetical protein